MFVDRQCVNCDIRQLNCFAKLTDDDVKFMNSSKTTTLYAKGQVIFHEGRKPAGIYCLNEGKIKIYRIGPDGKEQIVRFVTPGELFGLRSLIGCCTYSTIATTLEDSIICFIPKKVFLRITIRHPEISHCFMVELSHLLEDMENKLISLAQKPVRERLAETLLALNSIFNKNGDSFSINLSRSDLANIVGTATETVIRLLSEFKDEQLIQINGRRINILDIDGLKRTGKIAT